MNPTIRAPRGLAEYPISPTAVTADAIANLTALQKALQVRSVEALPDAMPVVPKEWVEDVSRKKASVPPGLFTALETLPINIAQGSSVAAEITALLSISALRVDPLGGDADTALPIKSGPSSYAAFVIKQVLPYRSIECVQASAEIWRGAVAAWETSATKAVKCRRLTRVENDLGWLLARLNIPQTYDFFISFLHHPWPAIRDQGAHWLKNWENDTLAEEICRALLMGRDDPKAPEYSRNLLSRLRSLQDPKALPTLYQLRDTSFDGPLLHSTISVCETTALTPAEEAANT